MSRSDLWLEEAFEAPKPVSWHTLPKWLLTYKHMNLNIYIRYNKNYSHVLSIYIYIYIYIYELYVYMCFCITISYLCYCVCISLRLAYHEYLFICPLIYHAHSLQFDPVCLHDALVNSAYLLSPWSQMCAYALWTHLGWTLMQASSQIISNNLYLLISTDCMHVNKLL